MRLSRAQAGGGSVVYLKSPVFSRRSLNSISSEEAKRQSVKSMGSDSSSSGPGSLLTVDIKNFKAMWNEEVYQNRERWKAQAGKGAVYTRSDGGGWGGPGFKIPALIKLIFQTNSPEWEKLAYNVAMLLTSGALSCLGREGFSLTCICGGFSVLRVRLCFLVAVDVQTNKFGLNYRRIILVIPFMAFVLVVTITIIHYYFKRLKVFACADAIPANLFRF